MCCYCVCNILLYIVYNMAMLSTNIHAYQCWAIMTFSAYHNTLGEYHDIPDVLVEFKLLGIKVTLTLN